MPAGTCDPASRGDTWNVLSLDYLGVILTVEYGWDGVSTRATGCVGPINTVRVQNTAGASRWWHTVGKRGQPHTYEIPANTNQTFTKNQARQRGFDDNTDFEGLTITAEP